ncbi:unnamed protein product [Meloidogyne enterolobii]|uniref:Uncharacterized protein n=1 Tax=Meloidogyne enterolobii TaxID=390850 RepID=A0ACB0ZPD1_MELEN
MKKYFIFSLFLYLLIPSSFGTKLAHLLNNDQEKITLNILDEEIAKIMEEAKENLKDPLKNKPGKSEIEEIKEDEDFEVKEEENVEIKNNVFSLKIAPGDIFDTSRGLERGGECLEGAISEGEAILERDYFRENTAILRLLPLQV